MIDDHNARILFQVRLLSVLLPPAGWAAGRPSDPAQPRRGGGESSGPPSDVQLRLPLGVRRPRCLLRGGRPRPPDAGHPEPPVAEGRPGQRHARPGGPVVVGSGDRAEEEERPVRGAAGRPAGLHHRPGSLLHGGIPVGQGEGLSGLLFVPGCSARPGRVR